MVGGVGKTHTPCSPSILAAARGERRILELGLGYVPASMVWLSSTEKEFEPEFEIALSS
jgi:hypothetical protein